MKKLFYLAMAVCMALFSTACTKENVNKNNPQTGENVKMRKFSFNVEGDFVFNDMGGAKSDITIDGRPMTDLWVLDYQDGVLKQVLHQTPADSSFGNPTMDLRYGSHNLYFIVSRGTGPDMNLMTKSISWTKPSDTFWKDYQITVTDNSNTNRSLTLGRMVTRFKVIVLDTLPANAATVSVRPSRWYYGFNYQTGAPAFMMSDATNTISIPAGVLGTDSNAFLMYGFSGTNDWTANVHFSINDNSGPIERRTFENVSFRRNRSTDYSGYLFRLETGFSLGYSDWETPSTGTF